MAFTVAAFCFVLGLAAYGTNAVSQIYVLHSPESVEFTASGEMRRSMLKEVISALLGLSTDQYGYWDALNILDPFETPEAAVLVYVDGIPSLSDFFQSENLKTYALVLDEQDFEVFDFVKDRIRKQSTEGNNIVNIALISLTYDVKNVLEVFGELQVPKVPKLALDSLKYSVEEDYQFLSELEALKAITAAVKSNMKPDNKIDFYDFWFSSLHTLTDFHGPNSQQAKEAIKLLDQVIEELKHTFVKVYDGRVVFMVVSTDEVHVRGVRQAKVKPDFFDFPPPPLPAWRTTTRVPVPKSTDPPPDTDSSILYHMFFGIGMAFSLSMCAIISGVMHMDPGRDSIVYRMTNPKMKKEN